MVIPDISIACFAALSASSFPLIPMCAGTLHNVRFYSLVLELFYYVISDLVLGDFLLLLNMAPKNCNSYPDAIFK